MRIFVKAVITGFGLSLGSALYKKLARRLGIDDENEDKSKDQDKVNAQDGVSDPGLQRG